MANPSPSSRLLQLPRELRDIVTEYALTENGGLVADAGSSLASVVRFRAADARDDYPHESNQLRLVCRQLYMETSALGLRYNDLTFSRRDADQEFVTVYELLDQFFHDCAPRYLQEIRRITILDTDTHAPWRLGNIDLRSVLSSSLLRFCRKYRKATVIVRFAWLELLRIHPRHLSPLEGFECIYELSKVVGHQHPLPCDLGGSFETCAEDIKFHLSSDPCPKNLRFSCAHNYDETDFLDDIIFKLEDYGKEPWWRGSRDEWMEIARLAHENGI